MNALRTRIFVLGSHSALASFVSCMSLVAACSNDNNGGSPDASAGAGGSTSSSGGTSAGGASGSSSGGTSAGGSSTGGAANGGTGNMDGGVESGTDGGDGGVVVANGIRIVHAAPDAGSVDVYLKGSTTPVATGLQYGDATPYVALSPGDYQFDIRAGGSAASAAPAFETPPITIAAGQKYTAVAAGKLGSTDAEDQFRVVALQDAFGPADANKARVRVVHAGVDAPTVGIDVNNDNAGTPDLPNIARFAATDVAGAEIPSGLPIQLGIVASGKTLTVFQTPSLAEGDDVLLVATGLLGELPRQPEGFALLAVMPNSTTTWILQNPRVYALHASPDAGAVDVYLGPIEVVDNASYGNLLSIQAPPGAFPLDLFPGVAGATPRPSGSPIVSVTTPALAAGQEYLAVLAGKRTANTPTLQLLTIQEGFDLADTANERARVVHASSNAPTVDVGTVTTPGTLNTPPLLTNVAFTDSSPAEGLSLTPTAVTLGVAPAGSTATIAEFSVTPVAGHRTFLVAGGDYGAATHPFGLFSVETSVSPWTSVEIAPN